MVYRSKAMRTVLNYLAKGKTLTRMQYERKLASANGLVHRVDVTVGYGHGHLQNMIKNQFISKKTVKVDGRKTVVYSAGRRIQKFFENFSR